MPASLACYGPLGPQAGDDPHIVELLQRTVDGQWQAMQAFEMTLDAVQSNGLAPWAAPIPVLTLLNWQWLALVSWEQATAFLDAAIATDGTLGNNAYRQGDTLCDQATQISMRAVSMQTEVSQGKRPANVRLAELPRVAGNAANARAVWATLEAVYIRVAKDLKALERIGVPSQLDAIRLLLTKAFEPKAQMFKYLQAQWLATSSPQNRAQLVQEGLPLAQDLYSVGQQAWTPYLFGSMYIDLVRGQSIFGSLNLGFDPWVLTDPNQVKSRATDPASCKQLIEFWQGISDPASAKALQDEINQAVSAGQATIHSEKAFRIAPWHPHYAARSPLVIAQQRFETGDLFTLYPRSAGKIRVLEVRKSGRV